MTKKILLLDNLRSMNNVGAIFRSVDGAGWDKIILAGYTPTPPRKEISKTALGAETSVIWEYYENTSDAIRKYQEKGYVILAAEKNDISVNYKGVDHLVSGIGNLVLIVGNEVGGVSEEALQGADHVIHLPMHGEKSSLNVAVAAGVLLYHFS